MSVSYDDTVARMSAVDMEMLIRAYVRRHVPTDPKKTTQVYLSGSVPDGKLEAMKLEWSVTVNWDDSTRTKGERLDAVAVELQRRLGWQASSAASLLLIEGTTTTEEAGF